MRSGSQAGRSVGESDRQAGRRTRRTYAGTRAGARAGEAPTAPRVRLVSDGNRPQIRREAGVSNGNAPSGRTAMHRILFALAAAATLALGAAAAESDDAPSIDRLGTLALIEQDFLREDSRVFRNREGGETVEASVTVNAVRYKLGLQRP